MADLFDSVRAAAAPGLSAGFGGGDLAAAGALDELTEQIKRDTDQLAVLHQHVASSAEVLALFGVLTKLAAAIIQCKKTFREQPQSPEKVAAFRAIMRECEAIFTEGRALIRQEIARLSALRKQ